MRSPVFALALALPLSGHALVRLVASCETSNHEYSISVTDNQGTGPERAPNYQATMTDRAGKVVAAYPVAVDTRMKSVSFGRPAYDDRQTGGENFRLAGPSTNFRNYILTAKLNAPGASGEIKDENLLCDLFN